MITLLWPDGHMTTGKTWPEVEDAVRMSQPHTFATRHEFRQEMRHRAHVWSGKKVRAAGTSEAFMLGLAKAGLFMVVDE